MHAYQSVDRERRPVQDRHLRSERCAHICTELSSTLGVIAGNRLCTDVSSSLPDTPIGSIIRRALDRVRR